MSTTATESLLSAALALARRRWPVLPVAASKAPLTKRGFKDATVDEEEIRDYWTRWPNANIGIATGTPSGIVVIDVDGPEGEDALEALKRIYGRLPPTLEARTGRGRHLLFKTNGRCPTGKLGQSLDCKGDGGYVVVPPSLHASGNRYEWLNDLEPAELPSWVPLKLRKASQTRPADRHETRIPAGNRNNTLAII